MSVWTFAAARWVRPPAARYGVGIAEVLGRSYSIREVRLAGDEEGLRAAWDLATHRRTDGVMHRVVDGPWGVSCSCEDAVYREKEGRELCRHGRAVVLLYPGQFVGRAVE